MEIVDTRIRQGLNEDNPFIIRDVHIAEHNSRPFKTDGGAICLCTSGEAELRIGTRRFTVSKGCEVIALDECPLFIKGCSTDFALTIFLYSKEIASQAMHKFDPSFFGHIIHNPIYRHTEPDDASITSYMKILRNLQNDSRNRFSTIIATNLLRSMMLNIYDKVHRYGTTPDKVFRTRKEDLFNKFMALINEHGRRHRDVAFYADELCISPRYLSEICREVAKESPKQTIDSHIISEIKLLLTFSDMSIQQIADYMHFPDQSYLGRFFKHYTGISPLAYRKKEASI